MLKMNFNTFTVLTRYVATFSKLCNKKLLSASNFNSILSCQSYSKHSNSKKDGEVEIFPLIDDDDLEFAMKPENSNYKNVDIEKICEGNPDKIKTMKLYQLEIDLHAQKGGEVPETITVSQWRELFVFPTKSQRLSFMRRLWLREIRMKNEKALKQVNQEYYENYARPETLRRKRRIITTNSPVEYGLLGTSLFHRIYDKQIKHFLNYKLLEASMYGPDLLIDCGYEDYMTPTEKSQVICDILLSWSKNRDHFFPHNLIYCNLNPKSDIYGKLRLLIPSIDKDPTFPFIYTEKSYLDLFPKKQLIYLSPNADNCMDFYEPNSIYILGAFFDLGRFQPLSLAKAKKDNIRCVKFPIDKHVKWISGSKTFDLNQCIGVLNDIKDGCSWKHSFRNLLQRNNSFHLSDEYDESETKQNSKSGDFLKENFRQNMLYNFLLKKKHV